MHFASIARYFQRRRRRRDQAAQRRLQRHESSQAMSTVSGILQVPGMEAISVEFDMNSNRTMPYSVARTECLGRDQAEISMNAIRSFRAVDPSEVTKEDQKKLRKALERAVRQERNDTRKMKRLNDKKLRRQSSSSKRIALLSAGTARECSVSSDQEILAEIWAQRPSSLNCADDDDMPEVDEDLVDAPMEFLFFTGCPDDKSLRELDVGNRRLQSNPRAARYAVEPSYATTVHVKPTLVSHMPPLFSPRFDALG